MKNITRREFGGHLVRGAAVVMLAGAAIDFSGCTLESAITEADNILTLIAPLGDGVAAIIAIADPVAAPAVAAASKIYDLAVVAVENFLSQWAAASAAAQPGLLSQAQAAVVTLQSDAANLIAAARVTDAQTIAEVSTLTGAITSEVSALLKVIPQIGALGGTTAALAKAAKSRRLNVSGIRSAKDWRGSLVKQLKQPTGRPIDPVRVTLALKLEGLQLK